MDNNSQPTLSGDYSERGEYHRQLPADWPYYPVYVEKMASVRKFLNRQPVDIKILDIGCGEGILVEEYRAKGYGIIGLDKNYQSNFVQRGDILNSGLPSKSFDLIICLDVLEHLSLGDQEPAIAELYRLLKPGGQLLLTVPNLAHLLSRLTFLLSGRLIRTSQVSRHPGDRPINEYLKMLEQTGFVIINRNGFFPTFPVTSLLTKYCPQKVVWWHKLLNRTVAYPNWCFLNQIICRRP